MKSRRAHAVATRDTDAIVLGAKIMLDNLMSGLNTVKQIRSGRALFGNAKPFFKIISIGIVFIKQYFSIRPPPSLHIQG